MTVRGTRKEHFVYRKGKDPTYYRGKCGKKTYISKSMAAKVVKNIQASGHAKFKDGSLGAYYCNDCSGYHVGHDRFQS